MKKRTFNKILDVNTQKTAGGIIISVAVEIETNIFAAYYKAYNYYADRFINETIKKGRLLSERKAKELFDFKLYKYVRS